MSDASSQPLTIGVPKETQKDEHRVALTPETAGRIQKLGYELRIQKGAGADANFSDEAYREAGVEVVDKVGDVWKGSDIIMKVRPPVDAEVKKLGKGKTLISFLYPGQNEDLLKALNDRKPEAVFAMDMVPRISRAQKLDALSSMANIAGYRAVVEAANNFGRFFTGQVTAAGKVPPAIVLVIGAGVAGLAAIGAARGMGAIVRSFDIRPEVAEQIESMGAEFLFLDFEGEGGGTEGGYAKPSSPEFREKQLALFREQAPRGRHRHHHGADPGTSGAEALAGGHGRRHEARLGGDRSRRRTRRQLRFDRPRRENGYRQRGRCHRLYRPRQPHGGAVQPALRHQSPPSPR